VRLVGREDRARARLTEFLRARGLEDRAELAIAVDEIVGAVVPLDVPEETLAAVAVDEASFRIERWLRDDVGVEHADPRALRRLLRRSPALFLSTDRAACEVVRLGLREGAVEARHAIPMQSIRPIAIYRWLALSIPVVIASAAAFYAGDTLFSDGPRVIEGVVVLLVWILFALSAMGATLAAIGYVRRRGRTRKRFRIEGQRPRTAVLMPVYNEDPKGVFARLEAMRASLGATRDFELWVLSDTRDPAIAADEERMWRRVAGDRDLAPIFYRRRDHNRHQKAGNIADFCERWIHRYRYMVVLDADSLVSGRTLYEMVARMESSPALGMLQAPIALVGGETLAARVQSFAQALYGPLFLSGLAASSDREAVYFGHNAILRTSAFVQCCGLPVLDGEPPFGGPIMSHDFVEAALMCRAGWEVRIADDLDDTFEAPPPTLREFLVRDRRWCQGNLQNLRIAFAQGLKTTSRIHLLLGALAYAVSPLWLAFLGAMPFAVESDRAAFDLSVLFTAAFALLGFPKALGVAYAMRDERTRRGFGGAWRLAAAVSIETAITSALAPVLMWKHSRFVLEVIAGRAIGWGSQRRTADPTKFASHLADHLDTTFAGIAIATASSLIDPLLGLWLAPVTLPLVSSSVLSYLTASPRLGRACATLLATPAERNPPPIVAAADRLTSWTVLDDAGRFRDLVLDPALNAAWVAARETERCADYDRDRVAALLEIALVEGPAALTAAERTRLLFDAESMRTLHQEAWKHWPVERWNLGSDLPREPSDHEPEEELRDEPELAPNESAMRSRAASAKVRIERR
jgi:membrane glycosyltransferase